MTKKISSIPPGELSAYERWELPTLNDSGTARRSRSAVVKKKIKPLTAGDIEKIRQQAYSAGFDEGKVDGHEQGRVTGFEEGKQTGHQEGLQQGLTAGKTQIDEQIAQLKKQLSQLVDPINTQRKQVEQSTLNIALALARTVIHRELKLDSASIKIALSHIFQSLPKMDQGLVLNINPLDEMYIKQAFDMLDTQIELRLDETVTNGGFVLETTNQLIDYTIEKRFQKVVHAMLLNSVRPDSDENVMDASSSIKDLSDYPSDLLDKADSLEVAGQNMPEMNNDQIVSSIEKQKSDDSLNKDAASSDTGNDGLLDDSKDVRD